MKITHVRFVLLVIICFGITISVFAQDDDTTTIINAVIEASTAEILQSSESPDGNYIAEVTVYPCIEIEGQDLVYSYEKIELINRETEDTQIVAEQLLSCGGLGAYGLWVRRWSESGIYFFYTDAREGTPDGLAIGWVAPLYRVEVATMAHEGLGQAQFSPDSAWIVQRHQDNISLMQPESDEATGFSLEPAGLQITQVIWLPDSSGLIYMQADVPFLATKSAVTHIDLATMEQSVLLDTSN